MASRMKTYCSYANCKADVMGMPAKLLVSILVCGGVVSFQIMKVLGAGSIDILLQFEVYKAPAIALWVFVWLISITLVSLQKIDHPYTLVITSIGMPAMAIGLTGFFGA